MSAPPLTRAPVVTAPASAPGRASPRMIALAAVLTVLALSGCRAFQPEAPLVNKSPETFITGAPTYNSGGYYRFHVYWYGRDEDGYVARFVWALTDGTVQNPYTDDDEEDLRFNPGLNASTLAIGHWTTRTDSLFTFSIGDGASPSADLTLHMVAVDDRGAYDRTPARLHFFANTLGNPALEFFRVSGNDTVPLAYGQVDTVGYGRPYRLLWRAHSANVRGYRAAALAMVDTVAPYDDGVLGCKWTIAGAVGGNCDPTHEDCWHPRKFNEATNDSFSYFGPTWSLYFANNGSDQGVFGRRLPSGTVELSVNAIDVAGVEAAENRRRCRFIVNYDPQTLLLNGENDWAHPEDPERYPYYIELRDPAQTHHPFRAGERIPDRTYVVVKALARDDVRDERLNDNYRIGLTGFLQCVCSDYTGGLFNFASEASSLDSDPAWGAGVDGWYGDTLGFLTAPSTKFTVNMTAVDELDRRDGTPAALSFDVGYPPCVQCIELLPKPGVSLSAFDASVPCAESPGDTVSHPCLAGVTDLRLTYAGDGPNDLQFYGPTYVLVDRSSGFLTVTDAPTPGELGLNHVLAARMYRFAVLLHGQDDPREIWDDPLRRIGGWRYQISFACDPYNVSRDGGGSDDIRLPTWGPPRPQTIDPATGVWKLLVDVAVPTMLMQSGPDAFRAYISAVMAGSDPQLTDQLFTTITRKFSEGWVEAVAVDQTVCGLNPDRPALFNFFRKVRVPAGLPAGRSWRDCGLDGLFGVLIKDKLPLSLGAMDSLEGQPVRKRFRLTLVTATGEVFCGGS